LNPPDRKCDPYLSLGYPLSWTTEFYQNDELREHEECTLKAISINEPIDEKLFTLKGIKELKPGTYVHWRVDEPPPKPIPLAWDGEKITSKGTVDFELATKGVTAQKQRSRKYFVFLVNTILISGIVALLVYRAWRRQRS